MKSLSVILLLFMSTLSLAYADTSFEGIYGIEASNDYRASANQVVSARFEFSELSPQQKYTRLKNLQARLQLLTEKYADDPVLWFLAGLNLNNLAETRYLLILQRAGRQKADNDIDVSNYSIARSRAYENAIRLDSEPPHRLSSAIYATMGYGLSNKLKIKTYSREIELGSASENESNEWFMHWAKIDALVHDKKLDEAQAALAELKNLLAAKNKTESAYADIVDQAEQQVEAVVAQNEKRTKPAQAVSPNLESTDHGWGWKVWLLISIGIFTFVSVIVAAFSLRKQK